MDLKRLSHALLFVLAIQLIVLFILFNLYLSIDITELQIYVLGIILTAIIVLTIFFTYSPISKMKTNEFSSQEIALLYSENKSIIDQMSEAIISIDIAYNITTINKKAKEMFNLSADEIGSYVYDVFPHVDFRSILDEKKQRYNRLIEINGESLLISFFPLYSGEMVIGASAIFRSRLEVEMLLDQISGYQKISKALREQKHEFQNKLHVILGLIKMKDYETAENYIIQNANTTNLVSDYYSSRLQDESISALFVGKEIMSKQYGVKITLSSDSILHKKHEPINSDDLIIVIGNLIDNSIDAFGLNDIKDKKIGVSIYDRKDTIVIEVIDNAGGIDQSVIDTMFNRGVSTKNGSNRGTGLSIVKEIIKMYNGSKKVSSNTDETKISIQLKKVKL